MDDENGIVNGVENGKNNGKNNNGNGNEVIDSDVVTLCILDKPFRIEVERHDIVIVPPEKGTTITIPKKLEPIRCAGKHINKSFIQFLESIGIGVEHMNAIRPGTRRSVTIGGWVDDRMMRITIYCGKDWKNPPNPIPSTEIWIVSRDRNIAVPRYKLTQKYLKENLGILIVHRECINRKGSDLYDCLNGNGKPANDNHIMVTGDQEILTIPGEIG